MTTLRRSSSSYGSFADGIVIRGMPLLTLYPGNVYWVDENGGGGSKGTFAHPVATLAAAVVEVFVVFQAVIDYGNGNTRGAD